MNAANEHLKDVETLTVRVLDNLHDQEDMDRLSALLSESAEARSRYSELVILDSMLHWVFHYFVEYDKCFIECLISSMCVVFMFHVFQSIAMQCLFNVSSNVESVVVHSMSSVLHVFDILYFMFQLSEWRCHDS